MLTETKMDRIGSNLQWLYERMPRAKYDAWNVKQDKGVKIVGGMVSIPPDKDGIVVKNVYFGDIFTPGCRPIVTMGIISDALRRVYITIDGIGTVLPDDRGFQVHANATYANKNTTKFTRTFYVAWQAMGY